MNPMKEIPAEMRNHLQRITLIIEQLENQKKVPRSMATSTIGDMKKLEKILEELPPETTY
jgi:hypothetical protein